MTAMMMCGHAANAVLPMPDGTSAPACAICSGLGRDNDGLTVNPNPPDLAHRIMRCVYDQGSGCPRTRHGGGCQCLRPSSTDGAFFEYRPDAEFDAYYCGCFGWD